MRVLNSFVALAALAAAGLANGQASAATTTVAVAASFTDAANEIAAAFAAATGHQVILSFGATGQLYTQVTQGAPFQVFIAADDRRPALAVRDGHGVDGTVITCAIGRLVLYSADKDMVAGPKTLEHGGFAKVAIANPETAPYGKAAVEAMRSLKLYEALRPKIVYGQNISQAFQFVETGNAEIGFVALGQLAQIKTGSRWLVPQELYQPIRQDAVLLKAGETNPAATAFLEFLTGEVAAAIIEKYGYGLDR